MFEQESYDRATEPTVVSQPGELFYNYEMKSWFSTQTLYKVLAISAVLNLAFLAAVSQTNVLTARGCDSPWVGRVCQVVDMAYVGALLYGTEREYVDEAYENVDLGDAEITYIDVTGEAPPLNYPEGYFQIANPVDYQNRLLLQQGGLVTPSGTTLGNTFYNPVPNNDSDILKQRANPPAANPGAFTDDSNDSPLIKVEDPKSGGIPSRKGPRRPFGPRPNGDGKTPIPGEDQKIAQMTPEPSSEPKADPTDPIAEREINRRPLKDLAIKLVERQASNQLDLTIPFEVKASGKLNKDGKLEKRSFRYIKAESSDPQMIKDVQAGIEAFNNSGFLQYLSSLSGKTLDFTLRQDDKNLSAVVQSEVESETRAKTLSSLLSSGILLKVKEKEAAIAELEKLNDPAKATDLQNDKDDLELLKNLKIEQSGKNMVINFGVPKEIVLAMIKRKLDEQAAESKKPSGTTTLVSGNNTAIK